jgi:putative ABC transport system substrate-binding protein
LKPKHRTSQRNRPPALLALLLFACLSATANASKLTVIANTDNSYQLLLSEFTASLGSSLPGRALPGTLTIKVVDINSVSPAALRDSDALISFGAAAADSALEFRGDKPLLCALISQSAFTQILSRHFASPQAGLEDGVTALYLNQPEQRFFALTRLLVPGAKSGGAALGPLLASHQAQLVKKAQGVQLELQTAIIDSNSNPVALLDPLVKSVDVMVVMPDKAEWNHQTAKWLLYLSYRRRIPLIAFSKRYTEAGALASLYSSHSDVADEAATLMAAILKQPGPGSIHWPSQFSISTNASVARTLNLPLRSDVYYKQQLTAGEQSQ